ncbi:hypothetical protein BDF22DRAFT_332102 [Syncephalis plumigaleata]|nr:hypothetical protein BDF22DRAFT_332102 [Syncephalis plumigaleata]
MQSMLPALSVTRPVPVNAVRSAAMRNAAYLAHVASAHSSGANTPLRAASPFLSSSLTTTNINDQSKLYRQYRSSLASAAHMQHQHQSSSPVSSIITSQISNEQPISTLKSGKKSRKSKRTSTRTTVHHSTSTFPAKLLRFILLHLPLAIFAAVQLCIALVVAPFLLMFAIGVACGTAFLAALLDMWNPYWWRLVKEHVGSVLRPARSSSSRRSSSPASSTSPSRSLSSSSTSSSHSNGSDSKEKQLPEEKPLYERLIDDERRRVRDVTEKVRARRRHQQAASLSQLPSASSIMGASLVTGLAGSIETPSSYSSLPTRRQHRPTSSGLRMYKTATYPRSAMDEAAYQSSSVVKNSKPILTNDTNSNGGASASYRDATAELAALFNNNKQKLPSSDSTTTTTTTTGTSSLSEDSTTVHLHCSPIFMCSTEVDAARRPDRVGMSRMA